MPTRLEQTLISASRALNESGVRFALVGGVAVSLRAEERTTRDIDIAVAVSSDAEAEGIVRDLQQRKFNLVQVLEQVATSRLATARLQPDEKSRVALDLLFASSGIENEIVAAAEPLEILPQLVLPIARLPHLLAMKILSEDDTRLQDRIDIASLLTEATSRDISETTDLLSLIAARGFNRSKDLQRTLSHFINKLC